MSDVFMSEDFHLCTYEKHHKLKLYLFLTAMREYKDESRVSGNISIHYTQLDDRQEGQIILQITLQNS